ncbi:class I SAM-dependent methyltransferase [Alphaproteobacteria bacterium]|nr:class I SAM-dependent methyltransferase [Alphaproteobacteria bacterium]
MTDIFSKLKSKYKKVNYSCEVCSSKKFDNIINYGRIAEPGQYGKLVIKSCKICGYKMLNPRFQKQFYIDYYNSIYRKIAFGDYSPSNTYLKQQVMRGTNVFNWFNKIINIKSGFMLDHGCASGSTMVPWIKNGWNSCGIDPHKPSVKLGKKNGLNIKLASGESLPFDKNIFDVVLSLGSLEHSYDIKASIQEIKRVLKEKGFLIIRWRSDKLFGSPLEYYNHNHYRYFTDTSLEQILEKYGFIKYLQTNKKLETWESYKYTIFINEKKNKLNKLKNLKKINELKILENYSIKYYKNCKKIVAYFDKDKKKFYENFLINKNFYFWKILGGNQKSALDRSIKEAKLFIKFYEEKKVIKSEA